MQLTHQSKQPHTIIVGPSDGARRLEVDEAGVAAPVADVAAGRAPVILGTCVARGQEECVASA